MAEELTLPNWLRTIGDQPHGAHRRALVDECGELTFAELVAAMDAVATGLRNAGARPGDRVVTAMQPSIPHTIAILGTLAGGMVAAPLNIRLTAPEARTYLAALDPTLVLADQTYAPLAHETGYQVVELPAADRELPVAQRLEPLHAPTGDRFRPAEDDLAVIFATGGTTGTPKGAVHTHRSLWLWLNTCAHGNPRTPADVELFFSPFFHITLGTNLLAPLMAGGEVWIQRRFDATAALAAIDRGASRLMGAPTMFAALRARPEFAGTRRSNVTAIRFGSAPSTDDFVQGLLRDFPNARIRAGFGATEFGSVMGFDHEDLLAGRFSGVGRPLPGATVRILGEDGREVPTGAVGDLVVSCPWQTRGYYGLAEDTAATFRPDGVHIGDLASRTEDGWVFIAGRRKEMIISGGENVYPREVEEVVLRHPHVADAIVYGMPDEHWGERVEVGVVAAPDARIDLEELRAHCRSALAGYKIPKTLRLLTAIPLTPNNKPDRRRVRAEALAEDA
ncbi:class I adenylate-forming enzyme family protein [Saccharopolyspora sp. WRP15-2]|uniref:Class I adenylate-forming enzyme family protein n=1 Tax=Saccharopolyspora oryzae TaxID=2997343 RepID=A0ABT4UQJ6_9PSEU|nr:class I adenylate-forming enzyme family protein [Saccharopolyspora oryzae]MDA3624006.1 class I adenylate-forming enzyme family protein [Saccharopolyspora oryzae]